MLRVTLADNPYRAGTEESNHWIKTVYIRSEEAHGRYAEDRAKYGRSFAPGSFGFQPTVHLVHNPDTGALRLRPMLDEEHMEQARQELIDRMDEEQSVEDIIAEILA